MESYYSAREMADMYFMNGHANGNSREARRHYAEHYPQCRIPSQKLFTTLHQSLSESGTFAPRVSDRGRPLSVRTPDMEVHILRRAEEDPGTSERRTAAAEGIGVPLVWKILYEQSLYPYHIQQVQALTPPDDHARVVYCHWLLAKCIVNSRFVPNILFTDEAGFTRAGIVNFHNIHVWVDDNPHTTVASRHQHQFSINVWVGIIADKLLGPVVLPNRLTGAVYHCFLVNDLPVFLEHVPLHQRQHIWFMCA
jgi:hypothetical protein